jgi:hypothetical protein
MQTINLIQGQHTAFKNMGMKPAAEKWNIFSAAH